MWELINHTPFSAYSGFERDKEGRSFWVVWVKATFEMRHLNTCLFSPNQFPIYKEPYYEGEPGQSELFCDCDTTLPKKATDIVISARCYDAVEQPVTVGAKVGEWQKALKVLPSQHWSKELKPENSSDPNAITLGYQNTYGGKSHDEDGKENVFSGNPLGKGFFCNDKGAIGGRLPNLIESAIEISDWKQELSPIALTALPRESPLRNQYAGTYDKKWQREKSPLLPDDFDQRFWHMVPEDQIYPGILQGGEDIQLVGMMREYPMPEKRRFHGFLPKLEFELRTRFKGSWQETDMSLQTLHIIPDKKLICTTYCGAMPILAAANDVLLEESNLALRKHEGFSVRPEHANQFDPFYERLE